MYLILLFLFLSFLFSQELNCPTENFALNRSLYNPGDTLSIDDQNMLFPICNGANNYSTGDSFSFSDQIGKITLISMNATW